MRSHCDVFDGVATAWAWCFGYTCYGDIIFANVITSSCCKSISAPTWTLIVSNFQPVHTYCKDILSASQCAVRLKLLLLLLDICVSIGKILGSFYIRICSFDSAKQNNIVLLLVGKLSDRRQGRIVPTFTALKQPPVYKSQLFNIVSFITHEIEVSYFHLDIFFHFMHKRKEWEHDST